MLHDISGQSTQSLMTDLGLKHPDDDDDDDDDDDGSPEQASAISSCKNKSLQASSH